MLDKKRSSIDLDIFISFSSKDRDQVARAVSDLRRFGANVWWSDEIIEGRWDRQVDQQLKAARRVVAFVTENADKNPRDYIVTEIEEARLADKLIPIVIGERPESLALRGLLARIQNYYFDTFQSLFESEKLRLIAKICTGEFESDSQKLPNQSETALDRLEHWISQIELEYCEVDQIKAFSFCLSVAFFEGAPLSTIENAADDLINRLLSAEIGDPTSARSRFPQRKKKRLELCDCKSSLMTHPTLGVSEEIVSFIDTQRSQAFLSFSWSEFGNRRKVVKDWLQSVAKNSTPEAQMRIGLALGVLAQERLIEILNFLIEPWLLSKSNTELLIGDIALSVAAFDQVTAEALRRRITAWADGSDPNYQEAAVRLACGFSGARIQGLTLSVLDSLSSTEQDKLNAELLSIIRDSIKNMISLHAVDADDSLFNLQRLIEELSRWALEKVDEVGGARRSIRENPYPLALFLLSLSELPLYDKRSNGGTVSLQSLVANERGAHAAAIVFNKALERPRIGPVETRKLAFSILRTWINEYRRTPRVVESDDDDPLYKFAQALTDSASSQNDVDRIAYLFDGLF